MPEPAPIPIQNIFYLLCYAWDRLDQGTLIDVSKIESTELVDLFAMVLVKGIEHLERRGLERDYRFRTEELRGVRGRVENFPSARRFLPRHGRALCTYDELSPNTLPNQVLKATLRRLSADKLIAEENRTAVLRCRRTLREIDEISFE